MLNFAELHYLKKSVVNMETELYRKVLNKTKKIADFSAFKKDFKSFLLKHSFYMTNEFVSINRDKQAEVYVLKSRCHNHV
jgi:hypothetical protein